MHFVMPVSVVLQTDCIVSTFSPSVSMENKHNPLFQSWRCQVYLLQVPHLFIWHFTLFITGEPYINQLPVLLIEGKPSINAYFPLIFTCITCKLQVIYLYIHYLDFSETHRKYWKRRHFSSIVYPIGDTRIDIDGDPSIKELW